MKFNEIDSLKPLIIGGDSRIEFKGITCDSRLIRRGDLFAAIPDGRRMGRSILNLRLSVVPWEL